MRTLALANRLRGRSLVLSLALLALSACVLRREPPETIPDAVRPDGTPVVTAPQGPSFQVVDTALAPRRAKYHMSLSMDVHAATAVSEDGIFPLPDRTFNMLALEGSIQPLKGRGIGAVGRAMTPNASGPVYTEAAALFGSRRFAIDFGLATRRYHNILSGGTYDSVFTLARLGARSRLNIKDSDFSVLSRATRYLQLPEQNLGGSTSAELSGWSLEATLSYTRPIGNYPLTANLGYRREYIKAYDKKQTLSGLSFGLGLLMGRRPDLHPARPPQPTTGRGVPPQ